MPADRAAAARGALAGAVAAAVWALQQPLDKRIFGVDYDDRDVLGLAVTRGRAARPLGMALHISNGALFGAIYAAVAPRVPLPSWSRGPAAGLLEHAASWPLTAVLPRVHPAASRLPRLWGSGPALAQATWRHLLFGVVLGELERRLNAPQVAPVRPYEPVASSNGHGDLEHAEVVGFTPGT